MVSMIGWLDTSAEEQRRAREILKLFSLQESRDELGIGQVRDILSDALFPGTSVLLTRARYFLIVPWVYAHHARRGRAGSDLATRAAQEERRLIGTLRDAGDIEGLIGRVRGPAVKVLPSAIYWSGLRRYGILLNDVSPEDLGTHRRPPDPDSDELTSRALGDWSPTLPPAPNDFPSSIAGGLDLSYNEATWLREQMLRSTANTLLAHLLRRSEPPDPDSWAPWADSLASTASGEAAEVLKLAELFSLTMHGAALIYNFHLAKRYNELGFTKISDHAPRYEQSYADWLTEVNAASRRLTTWNLEDFWDFVCERNSRVSPATKSFVSAWCNEVKEGRIHEGVTNVLLGRLVCDREKSVKKGQSRLTNERQLAGWQGASGSDPLVFRWGNVKRIITDVYDGRSRDVGS